MLEDKVVYAVYEGSRYCSRRDYVLKCAGL